MVAEQFNPGRSHAACRPGCQLDIPVLPRSLQVVLLILKQSPSKNLFVDSLSLFPDL